ncbi:MAG: CoA pyrophosphatase [Candidimonas sp.]|nr:MAG: CoA pyrophosphatase [Candidimonas sp.]
MSSSNPATRTPRLVVTPAFDPITQPVIATKALTPLVPATLRLDFICAAFHRPITWDVEPLFARDFGDSAVYENVIDAAVFIALVQRPNGLNVIFTRRSPYLYDHAGQISFPGGRIEPEDVDVVAAALRETREEIGIDARFIDVIGTQPRYLTSTHFTMKPVVGVVRPGFSITPNLTEVAEVFEVPLSVLMDTRQHHLHEARLPGGGCRVYFSISWREHFIWGATAALLRNLYHYLAAAQNTPIQ